MQDLKNKQLISNFWPNFLGKTKQYIYADFNVKIKPLLITCGPIHEKRQLFGSTLGKKVVYEN